MPQAVPKDSSENGTSTAPQVGWEYCHGWHYAAVCPEKLASSGFVLERFFIQDLLWRDAKFSSNLSKSNPPWILCIPIKEVANYS